MSDHEEREIKWHLLIPAEVQCEYAGVHQSDYYSDIEKTIEVCQIYPKRFETATGYSSPISYSAPVTAYEGVAALGGELVLSKDHQPMIRDQGRVLVSLEQVDKLEAPDPWQNRRFLRHVGLYRELKRRFGDQVSGGLAGQEGPITTAGLLRGEEFFFDCMANPAHAHRLLDVCTEVFIRWTRASQKVTEETANVVAICDDYAGMLGPDLWPEFVLPYYRRIIDALGPNGCWMHTELVHRQHLPLLRDMNIIYINFAENQYITIRDVFEELPKTPFGWHILSVKDMLQGTPASIKARYREIVAAGVNEVRCELTVGTPPENICAFVDIAREMEKLS
jgi:uroporphyrinogen-III decarboxylase